MTAGDLIFRRHSEGGVDSHAVFSPCGAYRYALGRVWDAGGRRLLIVMLNPSRADERANDPTVERCERRARALGYGAFRVCNIFAYSATDPADLRRAARPEGPGNDAALIEAATWADDILCAWGAHGGHMGRGAKAAQLLAATGKPLLSLGETKAGHPRHPLYVGYARRPASWRPGPRLSAAGDS